MKNSVVILLLFVIAITQAQSNKTSDILLKFQQEYNNDNPEGIYNLFDAQMQTAVPLTAVEQIVAQLTYSFGNIETFTFVESNPPAEKHIVNFEKGKQFVIIALNESQKITGLLLQPFKDENKTAAFDRNTTPFQLPFKGDWYTFWGGTTKAQNYHVVHQPQKGAFDFIVLGKDKMSYQRSGTRNEDYYAFGKPLYAVCDATVVAVTTGVRDNKPGEMNPAQAMGNSVILKTAKDEYIAYAHFEETTIAVKEGETVVQGQYLGNCGNSGNSSEPHLHFHIQDGASLMDSVGATSYFENIIVNGELKTEHSPVRGEVISRAEN